MWKQKHSISSDRQPPGVRWGARTWLMGWVLGCPLAHPCHHLRAVLIAMVTRSMVLSVSVPPSHLIHIGQDLLLALWDKWGWWDQGLHPPKPVPAVPPVQDHQTHFLPSQSPVQTSNTGRREHTRAWLRIGMVLRAALWAFIGICSFIKAKVHVGKVRLDKSPHFQSRCSETIRNVPFH